MAVPRIAGGLLALLALAGVARGEGESCPPFEQAPVSDRDADAAICEPGVLPSQGPAVPESTAGEIVSFEAPDEPEPAGRIAGEALLALPKRADGSIPTDFELAPGAELVESYWSPVLCATVARVVGGPGASPEELVPVVPDDAALVPHHRYVTPADVRPSELPAEPPIGEDPYLSLQYGLAALGALAARPVTDGAGVTVAVLDSTPETGHRELERVRVEALRDGPTTEPSLHGTLVTGVISAIEGNAFGISGVAPGADLVAIPICVPKAGSASSTCRLYDVLRGIDRAWEVEARILNLSIVGSANPLLERAATRLEALGPVVVAAAGNEGTSEPRYPAAYPTVIGVGAVDRAGSLSRRSNRGPSAQILAPGVEILTTVPGDAFAFADGTSLAAAQVTGVLALLTAAGGDTGVARAELFAAGRENDPEVRGTLHMPRVCDVLARIGKPCPGDARSPDVGGPSPDVSGVSEPR